MPDVETADHGGATVRNAELSIAGCRSAPHAKLIDNSDGPEARRRETEGGDLRRRSAVFANPSDSGSWDRELSYKLGLRGAERVWKSELCRLALESSSSEKAVERGELHDVDPSREIFMEHHPAGAVLKLHAV